MTLLILSAKINYEIADVTGDRMTGNFKRIMENSGKTRKRVPFEIPKLKKKTPANFFSYHFQRGSLVDIICMRARRK